MILTLSNAMLHDNLSTLLRFIPSEQEGGMYDVSKCMVEPRGNHQLHAHQWHQMGMQTGNITGQAHTMLLKVSARCEEYTT